MTKQFFVRTGNHQWCFVVFAAALLLAWSGVAWGHAHPEQMTPAANAVVTQAPEQVVIRFSEDLEGAFSSIKVSNAQGESVTAGASRVEANKPKVMMAPLQALQTGTYTVHWHAVARDGHTTDGSYTFQVP